MPILMTLKIQGILNYPLNQSQQICLRMFLLNLLQFFRNEYVIYIVYVCSTNFAHD